MGVDSGVDLCVTVHKIVAATEQIRHVARTCGYSVSILPTSQRSSRSCEGSGSSGGRKIRLADMATPLRAFLMLHLNGTWDVEVYSDLEPLLAAWRGHNDGKRTAVIHVGFYCFSPKTFDVCAQKFPGHVLLTAAAKFAFPKGYEISFNPIDNIGDIPIYLATKGWGYESDEFARRASTLPSLYFNDDWIVSFVGKYPDHAVHLLETGITDDLSYIKNENCLEYKLRKLLGELRLAYLMGNDKEDPCLFSKSSPPWLAEQMVQRLNITVRVANVFQNNNIEYVKDLQKLTLDDLLRLQNFGRTSVKGLMEALYAALKRGPLVENERDIHVFSKDASLLSTIERTLSSLPAQQADILKRRMGLNYHPQSLAEIGGLYNVTRERIRQIEAKALIRLRTIETWDDLLKAKLHQLLKERNYPLPLLGIEAIDSWFDGIGEYPEVIRYLLNSITDGNVFLITIDDIEYFSFMTQDKWDAIQKEAKQLLVSGLDQQWSESFCKTIVSALLPEDASEFASVLWKKASERCVFVEQAGEKVLQMQGRGYDAAVLAVLDESLVPLHCNEITNLVSIRSGKPIDQRRVHQVAGDIGLRFGRGTYGLAKHLQVAEEELDALGKAAESFILDSDVERQWHCEELLELLPNVPDTVDKYHLDIALKMRGNLRNLGRMVWAEPGALSESGRLEVRETALAVIVAAGRPLTTTEIKQRICAIRGVAQNFQLIASDPLLKVGASLWGLNDRDFITKRDNQHILLDTLVSVLQKRTIGIHFSELTDLLLMDFPFSPDEIFGLYVLDPRLAITPGQERYIYLREWMDHRRETATEAAKNIMKENAAKPIHVEDLAVLVSKRIGRAVHYSFLYGALHAIEARLLSPSIWVYDGKMCYDNEVENE